MTSQIAISSVGPSSAGRTPVEARAVAAAAQDPIDSSPGSPNPTLQLNAALGIVVIEFVNKTGAVTSSIPTQQQLEAYKIGTATPPGQHPRQGTRAFEEAAAHLTTNPPAPAAATATPSANTIAQQASTVARPAIIVAQPAVPVARPTTTVAQPASTTEASTSSLATEASTSGHAI